MTARLRTHHMVLIGLGSALAAITACSAPEVARETDAKKTTQASSVVVELLDVNGSSLGTCSGTLIAPKMVLTAGHCIAGTHHWKVIGATGESAATVASTPWKNFRSDKSHPEHSDVGLIMLDKQIKLDEYPQVATAKAKDGTKGVRFHRAAGNATEATVTSTRINSGEDKGFRLNYLLEMAKDEFLDTGGAVLDASGKIVGVVSGKGMTSNLLHVARVDGFATWTKSAISCSNGLTTRTWGSSPSGGGGYGGTPSTSSGGGGWGGWGGGGGGWGSSSGGYGGGGGKGGGGGTGMDGGATVPGSSGNGGGGTGNTGPGGSTGGGSSNGGTPGSGTNGDGAGGTPGTGIENSCPGIPVCVGECGAGSNGNNGGTDDDGNGPTSGGAGGPGGTTGTTGGGGYDASGNPTTGGGYNKDGSQVPAGGTGGSGGYDASGNPTTGGGYNKDGSQVPAGGPGTSGSAGYDASGNPTTGGGHNKDGSQVPAGGGGGAGGFNASGNPTKGGGYNKDGSQVPAGGAGGGSSTGSNSGQPGDGENCEGASDNPDQCPVAPDSAACTGPNCGGCGTDQSCNDSNIDYGGCASCKSSGGQGPIVNLK